MTCAEFEEMAGALVLGTLDEEERRECLAHLRSGVRHVRCAEALEEARAISAHLAAALPARQPPPEIWNAIEARINRSARDRAARLRAWRELAAWSIAAAVLGLYLHAGYFESRRPAIANEHDPGTTGTADVRAAIGLLSEPGTNIYPFRPTAGVATQPAGRGGLLVTPKRVVSALAVDVTAEDGKEVRLWVQRAGKPWSAAGSLHMDTQGIGAGSVDPRLLQTDTATTVGISVDPPTAPTPAHLLLTADLPPQ